MCIYFLCFNESRSRNPMSSRSSTEMWLAPLGDSLHLTSHALYSCITCICTFIQTVHSDVYTTNTTAHMLVIPGDTCYMHACWAAQLQADNDFLFFFRELKFQDFFFFFLIRLQSNDRQSKPFLTEILIRQVGDGNRTEGNGHTVAADSLWWDVGPFFSALLSVCFSLSMF